MLDIKWLGSFEKLLFIGGVTAVVLGLYATNLVSYLLFHALIELATISVAFTLFILTWNSRQYLSNVYLRLLGIGYGAIALIDLVHTLAFKGMNVFPGHDANLPTQLWIAARYLQAITLVVAPFYIGHRIDDRFVLGGYAAAVAALLAAIFVGIFPDCYVEGKGLTAFKIGSEYLITLLLLAALFSLYRKRAHFSRAVFLLVSGSVICTIASEICFTAYVSVYGFTNMLGHYAKLAAFYLIYRAVLVTGFKHPFELIFRDLKQVEETLRESQKTLEEKTEALRESEDRLRRITSLTSDIVYSCRRGDDGLFRVDWLDGNSQRLFGYDNADLKSRGCWRPFVVADDLPLFAGNITALEPGQSSDVELRITRRDGSIRHMHSYAQVEEDPSDRGSHRLFGALRDITERKVITEALRESEARFRSYFELPLTGRAITAPDARWIEVNATLCAMLGYTKAELLQKTWIELTHPDDLVADQAYFDRVFAGEIDGYEMEKRFVRKNGQIVFANLAVHCLRRSDRSVEYFVALIQDIGERKRMEEALRRSEAKHRTLHESLRDAFVSVDMAGRILEFNQLYQEMLGYSAEELLALTYQEVTLEQWHDAEAKIVREQILQRGYSDVYEKEYRRKDGTVFPVELRTVLIADATGRPEGMWATVRDITERRRAEAEIQRLAQQRQLALDAARLGWWQYDPITRMAQWDDGYKAIFGVAGCGGSNDEILQRIIHPEDLPGLRAKVEAALDPANPQPFATEYRINRPDGRMRWVEAHGIVTFEGKGAARRATNLVGTVQDITDRKRAEEALRAALEEKTVLLKEVHHRVKNNLQIVGSLLNLQIDRIGLPEASSALRDMQNRVRSMALLHETLYRSDSLARIGLADYLERLCAQLWRAAGPVASGVRLERRIDAVSLSMDQAVPCGLLVNELVSNALKHAFPNGRGGRVRVEAQVRADHWLALAVADDGVGLPPGVDPDRADTLGLQLVAMLAAQLGGTPSIAREGGTEFRVAFPLKASDYPNLYLVD